MKLGICSIQKNRGPWIREWVVFHHLAGVERFYVYPHDCTDNTVDELCDLQRKYDITILRLDDAIEKPQLSFYQYVYDHFSHQVDWMAFVDGDEFLYSPRCFDLRPALAEFRYQRLSAVAVWWQCYGSGGWIDEPSGLIVENYKWRAKNDALINRHVKSILHGRMGGVSRQQVTRIFFKHGMAPAMKKCA